MGEAKRRGDLSRRKENPKGDIYKDKQKSRFKVYIPELINRLSKLPKDK